ncbi:hypothetical protein GGR50DRAFT_692025 [Xylaria sp. CBS 124048]|nr:hypothetical protein GGR50DRAFT_692025 [Xylaria sp. CBS 124048]
MASKFHEQPHSEDTSSPASIHGAGLAAERSSNVTGGNGDDASSIDHVQEKQGPTVPLTKRQKVKRHCGRFKWWYLGVALIILIIILPLIFTRVIPAITQDIVDQQKLPIMEGMFQAISPTQLAVTLKTQLDTPLAATLDPTTLFLYNKDTPEFSPFLNITLPKIHADHKTPVTVEKQVVSVTNETELVKWFSEVFDQPTTALSVKGKSTVHLGALKMGATIEKTIQAASLNGLAGFGIENLKLVFPPMDDGRNVKGTLNLPNSGVLTLGLGNLTLNLFSGDINLGYVTVYDIVLPPGNNTRNFDGQLYLDELIPNLGAILDSQQEALSEGNVELRATGNATIVNGVHIGFVEQVLNKKSLISTIPVVKLLGDVLSSFSTGDVSLSDLVGDTFGNSTFIEGLLDHWKSTGGQNTTAPSGKVPQRTASRTIKASASKSLLKMGLKLALAKL